MSSMHHIPMEVSDLRRLHNAVIPFFRKKQSAAKRNERFKKAAHWTEQERSSIEGQNRQPYSMALIAHKINTILATQRQNRTGFKVVASADPADEVKAELATLQLREKEKSTNFKYLESEIFDAGLSICFGAVELTLENKYGQNEVALNKVDYRDLVWDINAREYDLNDALFMAKIEHRYRYQLEELYGDALGSGSGLSQSLDGSDPEIRSYYVSRKGSENNPFDIISLFTHYQKVSRDYFVVVFNDAEHLHGKESTTIAKKFRRKTDAKAYLKQLQLPYLIGLGIDPGGEISKTVEERLDRYVFTGDAVLEYEETDLQQFPFCVYRSFHLEDDFWTMSDLLADPQVFLDRIFMQIDYSFGRDVKNVFQGNINALAEGETAESAKYKAEKTGGIIWTRSAEEVFKPVRMSGVNPQYFAVAQIMQQFLEDLAGGRSFQGLSEARGESGKAILAKQQQGELVASLFLDNLKRWKKSVGEKMLYWIRDFETDERTFKVLGDAVTPEMKNLLTQSGLYQPSPLNDGSGYITVNSGGGYLEAMDFELIITEGPLNEFAKSERLKQLIALNNAFPGSVPIEILLEYFDLDYRLKQKIISANKKQQELQNVLLVEQLKQKRAELLKQ